MSFFIKLICIILMVTIFLVIDILISLEFHKVAIEKGYSRMKYFWMCFFLGIVGYLLVIALPDRAGNPVYKQSNNQYYGRN